MPWLSGTTMACLLRHPGVRHSILGQVLLSTMVLLHGTLLPLLVIGQHTCLLNSAWQCSPALHASKRPRLGCNQELHRLAMLERSIPMVPLIPSVKAFCLASPAGGGAADGDARSQAVATGLHHRQAAQRYAKAYNEPFAHSAAHSLTILRSNQASGGFGL